MASEASPSTIVYAVVLAGGRSRRFGADKLEARLDATTILDRSVSSIPAHWQVLVVGPPRPLSRVVSFVDEEPPGSGPGAALVAGARAVAALVRQDLTHGDPTRGYPTQDAAIMVTLPGDAPEGGTAAGVLVDALLTESRLTETPHFATLSGGPTAIIGVDPEGQFQPLQIAVRGASLAALAAHEPADVVGASARRLVMVLDPRPVFLTGRLARDIDTPEDLVAWQRQNPYGPGI